MCKTLHACFLKITLLLNFKVTTDKKETTNLKVNERQRQRKQSTSEKVIQITVRTVKAFFFPLDRKFGGYS